MAEEIIKLKGLTKRYGKFTAVDHLDLTINKGEVFGLLGPNGAGKSTTILMLLGMTEPSEGTVSVCDIDPISNPVEVKRKVGYLPEDVGFYERYTGLENLVFTARLNGLSKNEAEKKAESLLERVGLSEHKNKKAGIYSRGMRQRLGLADVLIKDPEVIILDEPILGIDPYGVKEFLNLIIKLSKQEGITVLFSSHHLYQVQQVCDRVGLFVGGRLLAEGDINSLSQKLFGNSPYTVEIGVNGHSVTDDNLINIIREIDGVENVSNVNNKLLAECSKDVTSEISKTIINSGYPLTSLNKKEYGLDDIYYHYFEGGTKNE
ncbi:MAG: ABC transporter ATP-binding protein [Chlorobi bacterium]|nr:ABC transporter ATP-binding protein [Chlorobiota bacterium]